MSYFIPRCIIESKVKRKPMWPHMIGWTYLKFQNPTGCVLHISQAKTKTENNGSHVLVCKRRHTHSKCMEKFQLWFCMTSVCIIKWNSIKHVVVLKDRCCCGSNFVFSQFMTFSCQNTLVSIVQYQNYGYSKRKCGIASFMKGSVFYINTQLNHHLLLNLKCTKTNTHKYSCLHDDQLTGLQILLIHG